MVIKLQMKEEKESRQAFENKVECAKLIGNSAYGSPILNKEKIQ